MLKLKGCVRCGGDLKSEDGDWQCLQCGRYYYGQGSQLSYTSGGWNISSRIREVVASGSNGH